MSAGTCACGRGLAPADLRQRLTACWRCRPRHLASTPAQVEATCDACGNAFYDREDQMLCPGCRLDFGGTL